MTNPTALFTGVEAIPPHLALNLEQLQDYLEGAVAHFHGPLSAKKFRGGQSNPTYELIAGGQRLVLRRKPPGKLLPNAHAIDREFRILSVMSRAGVPVPRTHVYCEDLSVIGAEFYVADFVEGRIFWDPTMREVDPEARAEIHDDVNRWLARIHTLDYLALGLADWGRGEGYAARNLKRWSDQYRAAETRPIPDMHWLMAALAERVPAESPVALLHGDYGLYNIMIHPTSPKVAAIIDWEMSTLGDPFVDLAHHLRPWWLIPDPGNSAPTLTDAGRYGDGTPTMAQYVADYCRRIGRAKLEHAGFYLGYARFRYAAMMQGVIRRKLDGTGANKSVPYTEDRVAQIAADAKAFLTVGGSL